METIRSWTIMQASLCELLFDMIRRLPRFSLCWWHWSLFWHFWHISAIRCNRTDVMINLSMLYSVRSILIIASTCLDVRKFVPDAFFELEFRSTPYHGRIVTNKTKTTFLFSVRCSFHRSCLQHQHFNIKNVANTHRFLSNIGTILEYCYVDERLKCFFPVRCDV